MQRSSSVIIVGAGIFGVSAALELHARGMQVQLFDGGPIPCPLASSTDISKAVRSDYGADRTLTRWALDAIEVWEDWNKDLTESLYHPVGFLGLTTKSLDGDHFEGACRSVHLELGCSVEALDSADLESRFPQFRPGRYQAAHFNPRGGYAESGRVVAALAAHAADRGVSLHPNRRFKSLIFQSGRTCGIQLEDGAEHRADAVLLCTGAWTAKWLPELRTLLSANGQYVQHFAGAPASFAKLPMWCADISKTGWYGFPANQDDVLKVGHHGRGVTGDPDKDLTAPEDARHRARAFLQETFVGLDNVPSAGSRVCYYGDTLDGDFLVDRHPDRAGLTVACGGSGHGFKFAPVIGKLIADRLEGLNHPLADRFCWRTNAKKSREHARSDVH